MKILLLALCLSLPMFANAQNYSITKGQGDFSVVKVKASNVRGIELRLSQVVTRDDCNRLSIRFKVTPVEGNTDVAWHQTAFIAAETNTTLMYCPRDPVTETIYSEPVILNSLINENASGEILVDLIVSSKYQVEVKPIK